MADISITGNKQVDTLKREFKKEFGLTLDVKKGKSNVSIKNVNQTLKEIRDPEAPGGGKFSIRGNMKVGNLEKKFLEMGIKVNIKKHRGGTIPNDVTLGSVRKKDD